LSATNILISGGLELQPLHTKVALPYAVSHFDAKAIISVHTQNLLMLSRG